MSRLNIILLIVVVGLLVWVTLLQPNQIARIQSGAMVVWTCPECRRRFGAVGRNHMCEAGLTIEEFLVASPPFTRPVFERVHEHLVEVDRVSGEPSLIVDPLGTKVLFKNGPTFCILDVKTKWVAVGFSLRRRLESDRLSRKVADSGTKFHHVVNVSDPDQIDGEMTDWLTEAYFHGDDTAESSAGADPMVPDDVDVVIAPPP